MAAQQTGLNSWIAVDSSINFRQVEVELIVYKYIVMQNPIITCDESDLHSDYEHDCWSSFCKQNTAKIQLNNSTVRWQFFWHLNIQLQVNIVQQNCYI